MNEMPWWVRWGLTQEQGKTIDRVAAGFARIGISADRDALAAFVVQENSLTATQAKQIMAKMGEELGG